MHQACAQATQHTHEWVEELRHHSSAVRSLFEPTVVPALAKMLVGLQAGMAGVQASAGGGMDVQALLARVDTMPEAEARAALRSACTEINALRVALASERRRNELAATVLAQAPPPAQAPNGRGA